MMAGSLLHYIPASPRGGVNDGTAQTAAAFHRIILPDLAVFEAGGISDASLTRIGKIHGVTQTLALDGARVTSGGTGVNVIGVNAQQFRSWTPLQTASSQRLWTALDSGGFVASTDARQQLGLHKGDSYSLTGTGTVSLKFAGAAPLGISGIDVVVSNKVSARLGLIHHLAALISAPGLSIKTLRHDVKTALAGGSASLIRLRPRHAPPLVGTGHVPSGRPTSYIQLFQESAAHYCPGLPWTVLAAIGQIESGDRANPGVSSAGAMGPMQFLPSTWAEWGITAFGEPGPPNILDPFDAVPSAARYLCAAGGATAAGLPRAIFAYNHADWYVTEVLGLAKEYQQQAFG
ncbi:MAG TPA: lytic transglycosylase domain-containing protein [Streptosporangiaceae bacterium]